jgi:hypothetical protein
VRLENRIVKLKGIDAITGSVKLNNQIIMDSRIPLELKLGLLNQNNATNLSDMYPELNIGELTKLAPLNLDELTKSGAQIMVESIADLQLELPRVPHYKINLLNLMYTASGLKEIKDKIENITSIIKTKPEIFKAILKSKEKTDDLNEKSYAHPEIYDWNWLECNPDNSTQYIF